MKAEEMTNEHLLDDITILAGLDEKPFEKYTNARAELLRRLSANSPVSKESLEISQPSLTYGELPDSVAAMIEPHEWDNKTIAEQRDWAVKKLAAPREGVEQIAREIAELVIDGDHSVQLAEIEEIAVILRKHLQAHPLPSRELPDAETLAKHMYELWRRESNGKSEKNGPWETAQVQKFWITRADDALKIIEALRPEPGKCYVAAISPDWCQTHHKPVHHCKRALQSYPAPQEPEVQK